MVKSSDLFKLFLVIQILELSCALPLGDEAMYENGVSAKFYFLTMD